MENTELNEKKEDELLTCVEAANELRTSTQTIRTWILLGKIPAKGCFQMQKRGQWRIYRSALEQARMFAKEF